MGKASMFSLPLLVAAFLPALASSAKYCSSTDLNITVTEALWDGQCTYPKADRNFELDNYLGRWYQVAGTRAPFTAGCSCIYAERTAQSPSPMAASSETAA